MIGMLISRCKTDILLPRVDVSRCTCMNLGVRSLEVRRACTHGSPKYNQCMLGMDVLRLLNHPDYAPCSNSLCIAWIPV